MRTHKSGLALLFLIASTMLLLAWPERTVAETPTPATAGTPAPATAPTPVSQQALPSDISDNIQRLQRTMEDAERALTEMTKLDDDIGRLRDNVERVIARTTNIADGLRPRLADVRSQIEKLGPPPGKDQPAEAPAVAAERQRLNGEAASLDGAIKTLELTWVRARQTIDKITDLRLSLFTRSLMERMSSPLLPAIWTNMASDWPQVNRLVGYIGSDWSNSVGRQAGRVALLAALVMALYAALKVASRWLTARRPATRAAPLSFFERAAVAAWIAPVRAAPAVAAALLAHAGLDLLGLLYYPSANIASALVRAIIIFAAVSALVDATLAPDAPERRLVSLADTSALRMCRILQAIALVYAADLALTSIGRTLYLPLSLSVVQSLVASVLFVGLMVALLLTPFAPQGVAAADYPRDRPRWLKVPLWVAAGSIVAAMLLGYVALARFATHQIVMTGVVALVATLLFLAIRAFTRDPAEDTHAFGRMLEGRFGIDAPRRQQLAKLTEAALTLTLGILALPVLLLQWGFSEADIRDWVKQAFFGFEIGHFRISLARILVGILLFTALLFMTRVVQRWLREGFLSPENMDAGIAHSIDTTVGYAGIAVAALLAISYAGFDVTNLAIVAGALSVGIGFGLQSIVNNFVSGLILLFERPIKVGDWIVVGPHQGNVRRISVRSTEIETFDRASLIVPNSELIAGRVLNWTHRNSLGRVPINFTTGPSSDARQVLDLMLTVAKAHPGVLAIPAPKAVFEGFNATGLQFRLLVTLADVNRGADVQTELRLAIYEALRSAAVELSSQAIPAEAPAG